ncbi:MAG: hypothetical protein ACYDH0_12390 [Candidatus Aminicenantales bacterium]
MKVNSKSLVRIAIGLCAIGFLLTVFNMLALQDIYHDYVGTRVLQSLDIPLSAELPEWTAAKTEWGIARVSTLFGFVVLGFSVFALYKLSRDRQK